MIHVGVTAPEVEEAVSNRECNEPRIVSKILIRQESSSDDDASTGVARVNAESFVKLCARDAAQQFVSSRSIHDKPRTSGNVVDDSEMY